MFFILDRYLTKGFRSMDKIFFTKSGWGLSNL